MNNISREDKDRLLFNKIAEKYAKKDLALSSAYARKYQLNFALRPLLTQRSTLRTILDIGCGIGAPSEYLQRKYKNYIGLDHSRSLINIAQSLYQGNNIRFIAGSIDDINKYNINFFNIDLVMMIGVLHHLTNIKKKLDKLIESAVPSTIFVAIEPNKANFFIQLLRRVRKKVDVSYSKEQTYFSKSELFNIFERAGFRDIELRYQGFFSPPFAQVVIKPQLIGIILSKFAVLIDKIIDALLLEKLKFLSWNIVIKAKFPKK